MRRCSKCGTEMELLFISWYCPRDCDKPRNPMRHTGAEMTDTFGIHQMVQQQGLVKTPSKNGNDLIIPYKALTGASIGNGQNIMLKLSELAEQVRHDLYDITGFACYGKASMHWAAIKDIIIDAMVMDTEAAGSELPSAGEIRAIVEFDPDIDECNDAKNDFPNLYDVIEAECGR